MATQDAFDLYESEVKEKKKNPNGDAFDQFASSEGIEEEPWWKDILRTAYQIPSGIAQGVSYPLDLISMVGTGESLDPEEIEHLKMISEREGIPFDEEKYMEAVQGAQEAFPTQSNIEKAIEEKTGAPLTAKTRLQKGVKFASTAGKLAPTKGTFRGLDVGLPKPVLGAGVEGVKEILQEAGLPEPLAEIASFAVLKSLPEGSPSINIGKSKKPSGLTERRFENLDKPVEVSKNKINKINEKLETEFRDIASDIIEKSPIEETFSALKEDKGFKEAASKGFEKVKELAEDLPQTFSSKQIKRNLIDKVLNKKGTGFLPSEYDQAHRKFVKQSIKETSNQQISASDLIDQYRKNNKAFREIREPGQSSAYNRGKKQALLDYNNVIADVIEESFPDSEFSNLFKSTNKKWQEIMDVEAIDGFMNDLFEGKINFKKGNNLLEKEGMQFPFKRALGEKGYKDFEQLTKDLMSVEQAHKMMKVAKKKGFTELASTGLAYILHPNLGYLKGGIGITKNAYKELWQMLLDKPKLAITWDEGVRAFKKGDFAIAEKKFDILKKENLD